jgi:UDP-sulfoquinovose synthase
MKILILGGDGYLGWPTAMYLAAMGHEIAVVDDLSKRQLEAEVGFSPLWPIPPFAQRILTWNKTATNHQMRMWICNIATNRSLLYKIIDEFLPEAVVHYAEQPSAPYSMMTAKAAVDTQLNNVSGTLNLIMAILHHNVDCHIVKLGTMGEYGTPNIDIEEGWLDVEHNGRMDRVLFPKRPGSWYHLSKVHDSHNLEFACRTWGLRVTDLNQGIVYGTDTDETWLDQGLGTSFHYDAIFGTVINRFITQAVEGSPLTVYGSGSQTRGFLDIRDTIRCIELACETPPDAGTFRVINQFTESFSINDLAGAVQELTGCEITHLKNPRVEQEDHYYNAKHTALEDLGLKPHLLIKETLEDMIRQVKRYKKAINSEAFRPTVKWRN